ncbi:MAG: hypothetical protein MI976_03090, partial [Pseudomonadales bacterium]|nr:hypothetical protein [Pseudomonadales bacterium]
MISTQKMLSTKIPFEAKLLLLACLVLFVFGCGSGETSSQKENSTLTLEEAQLAEYPIVYITRSTEIEPANVVDLDAFTPGANLYVRATTSESSAEVSITEEIFGRNALYDVRDISISYDGTLMVFAARGPYDETLAEDEEQPSFWNLYEYNFISGEVYPIMNDVDAGSGHDITPQYLADGRIIFSSSRQQRTGSMLLDEGKPPYTYQTEVDEDDSRYGPSFAIHIAEFDANRNLLFIEQTTFNLSHDFDPVLLDNGKVVFSRWDASGDKDKVSFYQMDPD